MNEQTNREVVSVGLDFRPIPVDIGDGKVWEFDPDPSSEKWDALATSVKSFKSVSDDEEGMDIATPMLSLKKALAELLVNEKQQEEWMNRDYGIIPMQRTATALMEQWTGFPTEQPSSSGGHSKKSGSKK